MRFRLVILSFVLALVTLQCASTSTAPPEASAEAKSFTAVADKGVVYLYRRGRMVGAAGVTQIKINGREAGGTGPGTFFRWVLDPGKYVFSAQTQESSAAVELNVAAGEMYFIEQIERIGVSAGRVNMKQQDVNTGKAEVESLKLLISTYVP